MEKFANTMINNRSPIILIGTISVLVLAAYGLPHFFVYTYTYSVEENTEEQQPQEKAAESEEEVLKEEKVPAVEEEEADWQAVRVKPPQPLYAIYMTSWVAGTPSIRTGLVELIKETKLNAVVIDIKDDTGRISFAVEDEYLQEIGSEEVRIRDLREFIKELNEAGIYVIGRVSVFQDPYLAELWPEEAVRSESTGNIWRDRKGLSWVDPGSERVWEYVVAIGREAYKAGFDEINYDYIRFPSDGVMGDVNMPISGERKPSVVLEEFFAHLHGQFRVEQPDPPARPVISADVFGMVTTNYDDLGIGQILERAFPYFDHIAPMVYPSHYPATWHGLPDPAADPYNTVYYSLKASVERAQAEATPIETIGAELLQPVATTTASSSDPEVAESGDLEPEPGERLFEKEVYDPNIIRPWLQDFDLGATYTAEMVRAQIEAVYEAGLDSWMIWSPSNNYSSTRGAIDR